MKRITSITALLLIIAINLSFAGCQKTTGESLPFSETTTINETVTTDETEIQEETLETDETLVTELSETEVDDTDAITIETSETAVNPVTTETQQLTSTPQPTTPIANTEPTSTQTATYSCGMCNSTFTREADLLNHLEVVHGYGEAVTTPVTTTTTIPSPTPTSAPTPTPLPARLYAMANVTYTVDSWTEERGSWQDVVTYNVEVVQNNGTDYIGQWAVSFDGGETVANNLSRDFPYCFHYSNGYNITLTTEPYTK